MKATRLLALVLACFAFHAVAMGAEAERPFLAIWQDDDHQRPESGAPYLRVAIWSDGRALFADNPQKWAHNLREGQVPAPKLADLKKAIEATGIFELPGHCYLVPDAPVNCIAVDLGGKRQTLYWDEVEKPNYGINIEPKPRHRQFIAAWKAVNRLALAAIPRQSRASKEQFRPGADWKLKPAIQSE